MFAEFYEELYTSTTKTHEHEDNCEQYQGTMKPFTMQELNDAINQFERRLKKTQTTTAQQSHDVKIQERGHHHRTTDPFVRSPLLYKLFTHLFFERLVPTLDANQSADQAGFRLGNSTRDHFFTFQQLRQRATEWHQPLWVATIDFEKALDTVEHSSVWKALREQRIEEPYIQLLT